MISRAALAGIDFYQTTLSPKKGYRCAYSVLHGGTGCSGFVKHAIRDHGFWSALRLSRLRFAQCKAAAKALNADKPKKRKSSKGAFFAEACAFGFCGASAGASEPPVDQSSQCASDLPDCSPDCAPSCDVCSCGG